MTTLNGDCRIGAERLCALPGERLDLFQTVASAPVNLRTPLSAPSTEAEKFPTAALMPLICAEKFPPMLKM